MLMKYILKTTCLIGLLSIFACDNSTEPDLNTCGVTDHQWYADIIAAADSSAHLPITVVRYTYNENYYFELENPLSCTIVGGLYDCDGNMVEFADSDEFSDFIEGRTDRVVIWTGV